MDDLNTQTKISEMSTLLINGIKVQFPFKECYKIQEEFMTKVIEALNSRQNAMLESPTGTGKTYSLLSSTLAWMRHHNSKNMNEPSNNVCDESKLSSKGNERKFKCIYTSRTHSQLNQVVNAVKKIKLDGYKPKVVLLASRDHLCINKDLDPFKGLAKSTKCKEINKHCNLNNKNDDIKTDINNEDKNYLEEFDDSQKPTNGCKYKKKFNPHNENLNCSDYPIQNIEELTNDCKTKGYCPYYKQKENCQDADLILVPYNILFNGAIKEYYKISLQDCIVIIDEGHNVTQVCESLANIDITETKLEIMKTGVNKLYHKKKTSDSEKIKTDLMDIEQFIKNYCFFS